MNSDDGMLAERFVAGDPPPADYRLVDSPQALEKLAGQLERRTTVAVDLEADSMYHFTERVCLLQMAAAGICAVIDPLALESLSVLKRFFSDPAIRKIFHGADYDVRSLYRDFQIDIRHLFDTQLACMFLGARETGLDAVLRDRFGVGLEKKYQRKDWSRRPLPSEMLTYAVRDTIFLIPLADALERELEQKGRLSWVREECELLSRVRPTESDQAPLFLRFKGAGKLSRRRLAVLEAMLELRLRMARKKDRPPYKIMSNQALMTLTEEMPRSFGALTRTRALSPKQVQMFAGQLLTAIGEALALPADRLPIYPRKRPAPLSPAVPPRLRKLKGWRDAVAADLGIESGIFMSNALLTEIAVENPCNLDDLRRLNGLKNWQREHFGRDLLRALGNRPQPRRRSETVKPSGRGR